MKIAIIGCGDVGRCYARALTDTGHHVAHLCDSRPNAAIEQFASEIVAELHMEPGGWLAEADLVISAVFGGVALDVARKSLPYMHKDSIYADFTTASPADLLDAGQLASEAAIQFVDVAIAGAISLGGSKTPLLCAGSAADKFTEIIKTIGAPARVVSAKAGDAVALKLLRSVFTKGLEALAVECLMAAEHRGLRHQLYDVLSDLDESSIRSFMEAVVTTHVRHAGRRLAEVQEARFQLQNEGVHPLAIDGVEALFRRTSESIAKHPLLVEPTIENSLKWLFDQQQADALDAPETHT